MLFTLRSLHATVQPPFFLGRTWRQIIDVGYYSLPIVGLTSIFTGMVLALQSFSGISRLTAENTIPTLLVASFTRELAPVLSGLMVAGRVSAAAAAETGTMRVSEQIDALETMSANPYQYLVTPRLIASTLMMPPLVLVSSTIGVLGGYLIAVSKLGFEPGVFLKRCVDALEPLDVASGLVKAAVFGFLIALMGCYHGFHSQGGARGVGRATTNAVVSSCALILIANYFIAEAFFSR